MNFVRFNLYLLLLGIPSVIVFSLGLLACLAPMMLVAKLEKPPKVLLYPFVALAGVFQLYFWGFWAAICVAATLRFTQNPEVTSGWFYWIAGFGWCTAIIGWLVHKEQQTSESRAESTLIQRGSMLYSLVAVVAFIVFAFSPALALGPYGWIIKIIGVAKYLSG